MFHLELSKLVHRNVLLPPALNDLGGSCTRRPRPFSAALPAHVANPFSLTVEVLAVPFRLLTGGIVLALVLDVRLARLSSGPFFAPKFHASSGAPFAATEAGPVRRRLRREQFRPRTLLCALSLNKPVA